MKKLLVIIIAIIGIATANAQNFVDLGLPSGTLWKTENEDMLYFQGNAMYSFCNGQICLPTTSQWQELIDNCSWNWIGIGYSIIGPNGNSIILDADGFGLSSGELVNEGTHGSYWSADGEDYDSNGIPKRIGSLNFKAGEIVILYYKSGFRSIRLVNNSRLKF